MEVIIIEINIVSSLLESINSIFSSLISSINNNIYLILDDLLFISTDIFEGTHFTYLLGSKENPGLIYICNSLIYGFMLYYAFSYLLSHLTFAQVQKPSSFIFKLLLCAIAINSCRTICFATIYTNSALSTAIKSVGENLFGTKISFSNLINNLNSSIYAEEAFNLFTFKGLIRAFISIGFVNLAISYSLRYILVQVFILICPFAILSLSIEKFSWIFKAWCKTFLSLLFLQIMVSMILLITFSLDFNQNDVFSELIYIGSIFAIIRANSFLKEFMGGLTTDINFGLTTIKNLIIGG